MERREIILQGISKEMLGVEIGPYHSPLVPKSEGYRSFGLDIHNQEQLRVNASRDPNIPHDGIGRIEHVDLVGSAADLSTLIEKKGLLGKIDYVVSSHNFEHLPNPIEFLHACARVLKPDGIISMAIPDRRGCFDYFRPYATTADFLGAFLNKTNKPTLAQVLLHRCFQARRTLNGHETGSWDHTTTGEGIYSIADLDDVNNWIKALPPENERPYMDTHCFSSTMSSFELIIRDLHFMRAIEVGIEAMEGPLGHEFFVRLRKGISIPSKEHFYNRRSDLLHKVVDEASSTSHKTFSLQEEVRTLNEAINKLRQKEREQSALVQSMVGSKSWRFTAPFRKWDLKQ